MRVGEFEVGIVSDGEFRIDGGAMFGVVPKPLWERLLEPDERNRVRMGTNCLLVRRGRDVVLVEAGLGRKLSKKQREIYAVSDEVTLEKSLRAAGVEPAAVTHVVLTHLHFDHCGGATGLDSEGRIVPTFPNARHFVQRVEWKAAVRPTAATDAAYGAARVGRGGAGFSRRPDPDHPSHPHALQRRLRPERRGEQGQQSAVPRAGAAGGVAARVLPRCGRACGDRREGLFGAFRCEAGGWLRRVRTRRQLSGMNV
jgi:hypothetical protein